MSDSLLSEFEQRASENAVTVSKQWTSLPGPSDTGGRNEDTAGHRRVGLSHDGLCSNFRHDMGRSMNLSKMRPNATRRSERDMNPEL